MKKEYIEIERGLIPYRFEVELGVELFEMEIHYNDYGDYFTVDLYKQGEPLVYGERIVYGMPLFDGIYDERFPAPNIVPLDDSNTETLVTWENLNKTVFLVVDNNE